MPHFTIGRCQKNPAWWTRLSKIPERFLLIHASDLTRNSGRGNEVKIADINSAFAKGMWADVTVSKGTGLWPRMKRGQWNTRKWSGSKCKRANGWSNVSYWLAAARQHRNVLSTEQKWSICRSLYLPHPLVRLCLKLYRGDSSRSINIHHRKSFHTRIHQEPHGWAIIAAMYCHSVIFGHDCDRINTATFHYFTRLTQFEEFINSF